MFSKTWILKNVTHLSNFCRNEVKVTASHYLYDCKSRSKGLLPNVQTISPWTIILQECYLEKVTTSQLKIAYNAGCRSSSVSIVYSPMPNNRFQAMDFILLAKCRVCKIHCNHIMRKNYGIRYDWYLVITTSPVPWKKYNGMKIWKR